MDLADFSQVVAYTIDPSVQPMPTTISSVRQYNQMRVAAARAASNGIPEDVIQPLRRANSIDVVHNVPKHAKCQITKQYIKHGITLHLQPNDSLITVAPNYRERLRNLFLIFHFDDEIRSAFNDWVKRCGTSDIQPFLEYNSSSYVKKLYVVFQGLCNT